MDKKVLCLYALLCLLASRLVAQTENISSIQWATGLTWNQVKAKAKKENKYIFVDCFATWCKPCAEMDRAVYTVDSVGDYLNAGFISVKLQMDQTKSDDAAIKSWYKTASNFGKEYNLTAYPTLLFFTPSGEVATKEVGFKDPASFIISARNSKDPSKQYYILLKNYKKRKLDDAAKRSLIRTAKSLNDTANYIALRRDYFAYLHTLPKMKLYTKENIEFIAGIISSSSDVVFDMFYPDSKAVDNVMKKEGYARKVVDRVIFKEKANPFLSAAEGKSEPDWSILYNTIAKDYEGDYADRVVMDAKMRWYQFYGNDLKYATIFNDKMEKYGSDTTSKGEDFILNNQAFLIWMKINDVTELKRIIGWMAGVVRRGEKQTDYYLEYWPTYIDTYANLLYKVGETKEALKWQEMAVIKCRELKVHRDEILENYEKMKKGEPTWPLDTK
jgi:thioredoxin-related protein